MGLPAGLCPSRTDNRFSLCRMLDKKAPPITCRRPPLGHARDRRLRGPAVRGWGAERAAGPVPCAQSARERNHIRLTSIVAKVSGRDCGAAVRMREREGSYTAFAYSQYSADTVTICARI